MAMRAFEKFSIWGLRFLQLVFAIVMIGVFSWFVHEFHQAGYSADRQVTVPLAFSVIAFIICIFSIFGVAFLGHTLLLVAAVLDTVCFAGYLASAILYRHNYHIRGYKIQLNNEINQMRAVAGEHDAHKRVSACVRLGAALIILQVILFFFSMILSIMAARSGRRGDPAVTTTTEKRGGLFGRRRRHHGHTAAV